MNTQLATRPVSVMKDAPVGNGATRDQDRGQDPFHGQLIALRAALRARARFLTRDAAAAEDLVQATLERALTSRARFRPGTNFHAWARSIMHNVFIDACRRDATRARRERNVDWGSAEAGLGPLDLLTANDVLEAMSSLEGARRRIFELAYFQRLSYREIAAQLGIPPNTTGTRLFRVKRDLRKRLELVYQRRLASKEGTQPTGMMDGSGQSASSLSAQ